jgi:4-alpha-glucanotransferase
MKLTFRLRYRTKFGQTLHLVGNHPLLGGGDADKAVPLQFFNDEFWQTLLDWPSSANERITYDYILKNADGSFVQDWGRDRVLAPAESGREELLVIDSWDNAGAIENVF